MRPPVCIVLTSLALTGGIERDALKCIRAFGAQGRDVHIVAGFVRPGVKEHLAGLPVVWHAIHAMVRPPSLSQLMIYLQANRIVATLRRRYPGLVVISFEPIPVTDIWVGASPSALWREAKRIGKLSRSFKPGLVAWQRWAERRLIAEAKRLLVYSDQAYNWWVAQGVDATRLVRVIIPTDLVRFQPQGPPLDRRNEVLIMGANPRLKGIDMALEAWKTVQRHDPGMVLRIVCKGWKVPALVKRSGLQGVEVSPLVSDPERYYHRARLVLMPSLFESWGNVPLEALACGVPVVVSQQTPSSRIVHAFPEAGEVFDALAADAVERLTAKVRAQLALAHDSAFGRRCHSHVARFQEEHESTVQWLMGNV